MNVPDLLRRLLYYMDAILWDIIMYSVQCTGHTLLIQIINFVFIVISKITSVWNTVGRLITILLFANPIILSP